MNRKHVSAPASKQNGIPRKHAFLLAACLLGCLARANATPAPPAPVNLSVDPATNNSAAVAELISAINSAEAHNNSATINLFANGTYTLSQPDNWNSGPNGLPEITGDLIINGRGAVIRRDTNSANFRFFCVSGNPSSLNSNGRGGGQTGSLTLSNLTLSGGYAPGADGGGNGRGKSDGGAGMGGAIFNQGTLRLTRVTFTGNTACGGDGAKANAADSQGGDGLGGAICNQRGSIMLGDCTLTGNVAEGGNGFDADGSSLLNGGKGGSGYGGAIFNLNGNVWLNGATIISNYTVPGATITWTSTGPGTFALTSLPTGGADGGALYNLASGNRMGNGSSSLAGVCLTNCLLTGSLGCANDLVNQAVNGNHTNSAIVNFCVNNLVMGCCNLPGGTCVGDPLGALHGHALPAVGASPALAIDLVANHPVIFWPTNFSACTLEYTASLPAPDAWTPMTCSPCVAGGQCLVLELSPVGNRFYRLAVP